MWGFGLMPESREFLAKMRKKKNRSNGTKIRIDAEGLCYMSGVRDDYWRYEQAIVGGKVPCPFRVRLCGADGNVFTEQPIPLDRTGRVVRKSSWHETILKKETDE